MSKKRAYSRYLNMLSATQKFKYLEYLHDGIKVIDPIMDITFWKEDVKINFR
jgi:argininosuccinate synthase